MTTCLCLLLAGLLPATPAVSPRGNIESCVAPGQSGAPGAAPPGWFDTLLTVPDDKESRDPVSAFDSRGRLHIAWKDNRRLRGSDEIHYLMKDSTGWRDFQCVSNLDTSHNSPALVVDRQDNVHVFFLRWSGQPYGFDLGYRRRDGATGEWGPEERLTDRDSLPTSARPHAVVVADTVFVFWRIANVSPQLFGYIYNNGGGWSDYKVISTGAEVYRGNIAVRASRDGWIHVVWEDNRVDTSQLWHRYHDGDSWSAPYRTTFEGHNAVQPGLAFDSLGNLHVVFAGGPSAVDRLHHRIWDRATRTWGEPTRWYSWNGAPDPRIGVNLRTGERHLTHVGAEGSLYGLYYRRFDPVRGVWTDSTQLTSNGAFTGPALPLVDSDGRVHLVFWGNGYGTQEEIIYMTNRLPTGVQERGAPGAGRIASATMVVRNTLALPPAGNPNSSFVLLDAAGRSVLSLAPGPNDISHLAPGVYFTRGLSDRPSTAARVIIAR